MKMADTVVPFTPTQEPIWLECLRHPDQTNAGFLPVTIHGEVPDQAVTDACSAVCAAHPDLRGMVVRTGATYAMHIRPVAETFEFAGHWLPCAPGTERDTARSWYARNRDPGWDLTTRAPIRFHLLRHGERRRTLVVAVHHIAFDGRSKFVFARQFSEALAGRPPAPSERQPDPPPVDDGLVTEAVRSWAASGIEGFAGLRLPTPDAPAEDPGLSATPRFDVPAEACRALAEITKDAGTSFFTGLLACTAATLAGYGNDMLATCIPADTSDEQSRNRIGMQVNTVPVLLPLSPEENFWSLLGRTGAVLGEVLRYRRVPFHRLVRDLRRTTGTDLGSSLLSQLSVSYPRLVTDLGEVPGLRLEWDFFAPNSSRSSELTVHLRRSGTLVYGRLDYLRSIFDADAADDFVADWLRTLSTLTGDPETPIRPRRPRATLPAPPPPRAEPEAVRMDFASLRRLPAGGPPAAVACRADQFLPTPAVRAQAHAGRRIVLVVPGEDGEPIAWLDWDPAVEPPAVTGFSALVVLGRDGFELPPGVPGVLAVRSAAAPPHPTSFRARLDRSGDIRILGTTDGEVHGSGRFWDIAAAERRLATMDGVDEIAVVARPGTRPPRLMVAVVPSSPSDVHDWRRRIRWRWPHGLPRPARVQVTPLLARTADGRVDRARTVEQLDATI